MIKVCSENTGIVCTTFFFFALTLVCLTTSVGLIVFVQKVDPQKKEMEIYQAAYFDLPPKKGTGIATGIGDEFTKNDGELSDMVLYPNPVKNRLLNLRFRQELLHDYDYKIIDLRGVTIYEGKLQRGQDEFAIDVPDLPIGVNYIMISDGEGSFINRKVVVER